MFAVGRRSHKALLPLRALAKGQPIPMQFIFLAMLLVGLVMMVQIGLLTIAFDKLGLSADAGFLLLLSSLAGSVVNLPLFSIASDPPPPGLLEQYRRQSLLLPKNFRPGRTLIMVNVGGCVIPVFFSLYLLRNTTVGGGEALLGCALVTLLCRLVSRPIAGMGIALPLFIAPVGAAVVAVTLNPEVSAPLAYICGTLGVLIGADLLRLDDIRRMGAPMASIGGAGTYDGIFITGIVAALLA